ncbi:MAG TPA: helix-turn-helix domain-containing protein [Solirubrobacteraceae bacterium]|nr:helix-turn-helix domain-containing protein [Solirubrobacteraceae bacterium]
MTQARAARARGGESARAYAGKTLDARRAEQRERILFAARDVFAAQGYAGAGIEEIVARARVSRTTFYVFFANKEECLLGVFEFGLARIGAAVIDAVAETALRTLPPADRVREEVRSVAAALAADPAMARILLIEIVGATPQLERARARARHAAARIIEHQLEQYDYWRGRSPGQRRVASLAAMAAIGEPISDLVATDQIDRWEEIVEPVSEFVARGLLAPRDP